MSVKLAFIAAHMAEHAVRLMCRVLGVVTQLVSCLAAGGPHKSRARRPA
jgi:hypothetical protein